MRVEAHEFAVARLDTGDPPDEAPMCDYCHPLPVGQGSDCGAEAAASAVELRLGLRSALPPDFLDVIEGQVGPTRRQAAARRTDIAAEGGPLPHHGLDRDGNAGSGGDDLGRLKRPDVWAYQQSLDFEAGQLLGRRLGWRLPSAVSGGS